MGTSPFAPFCKQKTIHFHITLDDGIFKLVPLNCECSPSSGYLLIAIKTDNFKYHIR